MHSKIIIDAFKKAAKELEKKGEMSPSKVKKAEVLSDYLTNECKYTFGENRLRQYFNSCTRGEKVELKQKVILGLCKYLGYKDYEDYVLKNVVKKKEGVVEIDVVDSLTGVERTDDNPVNGMSIKVKIFILFASILLLAIIINTSINKQRWMVWQVDHYVEVEFDTEKYAIGQLKIYKDERIKYFKEIDPTCDTVFFNTNSTVKVWYGKNSKKELEYFTALGLHPETGKTLKPITKYMIREHICENY